MTQAAIALSGPVFVWWVSMVGWENQVCQGVMAGLPCSLLKPWRHLVLLQAFIDSSPEQLQQVVSTNMVGSLLCTRAAMQVMRKQSSGGHIFNMDGAGADGMPTPQYAAYGATKAGVTLASSLSALPCSSWSAIAA